MFGLDQNYHQEITFVSVAKLTCNLLEILGVAFTTISNDHPRSRQFYGLSVVNQENPVIGEQLPASLTLDEYLV
jgi:hypothetical protein